MKPDPNEVYHYQLLEGLRKALWIMAIAFPILLVLFHYTKQDWCLFGIAAIFFTCGVYFLAAYTFLLTKNVEVLRTFKMFSKNIHPLLEKRNEF